MRKYFRRPSLLCMFFLTNCILVSIDSGRKFILATPISKEDIRRSIGNLWEEFQEIHEYSAEVEDQFDVISDYIRRQEQEASEKLSEDEERTLKEGIDPDYRFNETLGKFDPKEKLISSPGCPESIEIEGLKKSPVHRYPWLYHKSYEGIIRCYLAGTQGPSCPPGTMFGVKSGSLYGVCKCNCFFRHNQNSFQDSIDPFLNEKTAACYSSEDGRHYAFSSRDNKCHPLMSQGPCAEDEWFILDSQNNANCAKRKCPVDKLEGLKEDMKTKNYFVEKGTKESCKYVGQSCGNVMVNGIQISKYFLISSSNWFPTCEVPPPPRAVIIGDRIRVSAAFSMNGLRCKEMNQTYSLTAQRCIRISIPTRSGNVG